MECGRQVFNRSIFSILVTNSYKKKKKTFMDNSWFMEYSYMELVWPLTGQLF